MRGWLRENSAVLRAAAHPPESPPPRLGVTSDYSDARLFGSVAWQRRKQRVAQATGHSYEPARELCYFYRRLPSLREAMYAVNGRAETPTGMQLTPLFVLVAELETALTLPWKLGGLNNYQRLCFTEYVINEKPLAEIAALFGGSEDAIRKVVARATDKLVARIYDPEQLSDIVEQAAARAS